MTDALVAEGIVKRFGGLVAVDGLSLRVDPGRVVALIGPNGAGKTTFFDCLTGVLDPDRGAVRLGDTDITRWRTARRARAGLARTFQRLQVFTRMTVRQNLLVAAEAARDERAADGVTSVLARLRLTWCADRLAGELPTGVLRLVELGRALCARPRILLLDEPVSGLDATERDELRGILANVAGDGAGVLVVDHDVGFVLSVAETIHVLDFGRLIASGTPAEIAGNADVRAAYLGSALAGDLQ